MTIRSDFERHVVIPENIIWDDDGQGYISLMDDQYIEVALEINKRFVSYLAGRNESIIRMNMLEQLLIEKTDMTLVEIDSIITKKTIKKLQEI